MANKDFLKGRVMRDRNRHTIAGQWRQWKQAGGVERCEYLSAWQKISTAFIVRGDAATIQLPLVTAGISMLSLIVSSHTIIGLQSRHLVTVMRPTLAHRQAAMAHTERAKYNEHLRSP